MDAMAPTGLTTVEAAERLGVTPEEIYRRIFAGELEGGPDADGVVRVAPDALERLAAEPT